MLTRIGHVVDQLLQQGYKVRGTVRNTEKSSWVKDFFDKKYGPGKFELIEVPEMSTKGAFDDAVKGASGPFQKPEETCVPQS